MTHIWHQTGDKEYRKEKREMNAPIEAWISVAEDRVPRSEVGHTLPKVLEWIAEHEDHPKPEECNGVDYRAIYRHLAHLMTGDIPPTPTSEATAQRILQVVCVQGGKTFARPCSQMPHTGHEGPRSAIRIL